MTLNAALVPVAAGLVVVAVIVSCRFVMVTG